jgi:hypothetical protein
LSTGERRFRRKCCGQNIVGKILASLKVWSFVMKQWFDKIGKKFHKEKAQKLQSDPKKFR